MPFNVDKVSQLFLGCKSFTIISLSPEFEYIDEEVFRYYYNIVETELPPTIISVYSNAFDPNMKVIINKF